MVGAAITIALISGVASSAVDERSLQLDSDGDGLSDAVEVLGWETADGMYFQTDPDKIDTDGDGLTDADEAGAAVKVGPSPDGGASRSVAIYSGYSNPLVVDSDADDLTDADEADTGLDPFAPDSDQDGLNDGLEVNVVGTSASVADSDGDGFDDGFEDEDADDKGLDPLYIDVKVSKVSYVTDFAIGVVAGDAWRKDSAAWLAGYLVSSGSSSIPGVGFVVGPLADVRDAIASAIRGDWVGSGFSALGSVPYAGDAISIPAKVGEFATRNAELAGAVAAIVVTMSKVPKEIKVKAVKQIFKRWDNLKSEGVSEDALLRLVEGKTNIDDLAEALDGSAHVEGAPAGFFETTAAGEAWLEENYAGPEDESDREARFLTKGCSDICNVSGIRMVDLFVDGVAHEARVGYTPLTDETERQIRSDAHLVDIRVVGSAHWHFMASGYSDKMGPDPQVLGLLNELGISYTIHFPA